MSDPTPDDRSSYPIGMLAHMVNRDGLGKSSDRMYEKVQNVILRDGHCIPGTCVNLGYDLDRYKAFGVTFLVPESGVTLSSIETGDAYRVMANALTLASCGVISDVYIYGMKLADDLERLIPDVSETGDLDLGSEFDQFADDLSSFDPVDAVEDDSVSVNLSRLVLSTNGDPVQSVNDLLAAAVVTVLDHVPLEGNGSVAEFVVKIRDELINSFRKNYL